MINSQGGWENPKRAAEPEDFFPSLRKAGTPQTPEQQLALWLAMGATDMREH